MKKVLAKITACAMAAALSLTFALPALDAKAMVIVNGTEQQSQKGTLSVNGYGAVKADPDMAMMTFGAETFAETAAEAQKLNTEIMDNVIAAIIELGIEEKDIQTSTYYMYEQYDYNSYDEKTGNYKSVGYRVNHLITVTVKNLDLLGEIMDVAVANGANQNQGLNFSVAEPEAYYIKALELAVANAKNKAAALARMLEIKLGAPISVYENGSYYVTPVYMDSSAARMNMTKAEGMGGSTSVSVGKVEITANVSLTYEYDK